MSGQGSGAGSNTELRDFLRSRRARITPQEAGLAPQPGTRRVPGPRREEVAQLAGVSVDYYVRLERGRHVNVSENVLDALARALNLNDTERDHLFAVARPARSRRHPLPPQRVRPGLYQVLESLPGIPASVVGRRLDVLATNRMGRALIADFDQRPHRERNMARYMFLDPGARELYRDWEMSARSTVAALHRYAGRYPDDPQLAELIGDLSVRDTDFRRWWADHDVFRHTHGYKRLRHPVVGDLTLDYESLTVTGDPEQSLGLYTAAPGSASEQALRLLASWVSDPLPPAQPDSAPAADRPG